MEFNLTYAGVPFCLDEAKVVRMEMKQHDFEDLDHLPVRKHQPVADLVDEINRLIPTCFLQDIALPKDYFGRAFTAIANRSPTTSFDMPLVGIGEWFYPNGACRFSLFRGLATSSQAKAMLAATGGSVPETFNMKCAPVGPSNPSGLAKDKYDITTLMYMLPPRCLGEHSGNLDGLYLITLVDERYYFAGTPVSLTVTKDSTWVYLIAQLATALAINITIPDIPASYNTPEPDSQIWSRMESASVLLDAVAYNIGCVLVRNQDGTYNLSNTTDSISTAKINRGRVLSVVRTAGGDIFSSGTKLPIGNLTPARNSVIPGFINVVFPKYVRDDDPVPHLMNDRYQNQRPSCWFEDGFGSEYTVTVSAMSGGPCASGLTGISNYTIHNTSKALMSGEIAIIPLNESGLISTAMQIASDYYCRQVGVALDEIYPGIANWTPEGIHDILWTYSARVRQANTRVMKSPWNQNVTDMQHSAAPLSGYTNIPRGVGGPSVAQTIRDSCDIEVSTNLAQSLGPDDTFADLVSIDNLPTQNRWRGKVDNEVILFEGTSGLTQIDIVYRGIDGTIEVPHNQNSLVTQLVPNIAFGVNLTTYEKGQYIYPAEMTSGGISAVTIVPQTQTVRVLSETPSMIKGINHYSGELDLYNPTQTHGGEYEVQELVWIVERNDYSVQGGKRYNGQFMGFSAGETVAPIYGVNEDSRNTNFSGGCPPIYLTIEQSRCESGLLNIYQKPVQFAFVSGCLNLNDGPWFFSRNEGCCACPTMSGGGGSGSGGSVTGSCIPGICTLCTDPPQYWLVSPQGFTGECEIFNRSWNLLQQSPCTWVQTDNFAGVVATVSMTVVAGFYLLSFTYGTVGATFVAAKNNNDCCAPINLTLPSESSCNCEAQVTTPDDSTDCMLCESSPDSWTITLTGFTGVFSIFNGTFVLESTVPESNTTCEWKANPPGFNEIRLLISRPTGSTYAITVVMDGLPGSYVVYSSIVRDTGEVNAPPLNCCEPYDIIWDFASPGIDNFNEVPLIIHVVPSCSTSEPGVCPESVRAVPICCNPTPAICPCISIPSTWSFVISGVDAPCDGFNFSWTLSQTASCVWSQTIFVDAGGGVSYSVIATLIISSSISILTITTISCSATYTGPGLTSDQCCDDLTMSIQPGAPDTMPASIILTTDCSPPSSCCDTAPGANIEVLITGYVDACVGYNGTWTLTGGPSVWTGTIGGSAATLTKSFAFGIYSWSLIWNATSENYSGNTGATEDLCDSLELDLNDSTCDANGVTLLITPVCDGGIITTDCCPDNLLPIILYAVVTGSGACDGTYALTWQLAQLWTYTGGIGTCPDEGTDQIAMSCFFDSWQLTVAGDIFPYLPTSNECNPFEVVFENVDMTPCGGGANATVTVTT